MTALLYADEQFPLPVVRLLREIGYDILTVREAGQADLGIPDNEVLAFATERNRAVLTINRKDFIKLHQQSPNHAGIIACSEPRNWESMAQSIHAAIEQNKPLTGKLVRVYRPQQNTKSDP